MRSLEARSSPLLLTGIIAAICAVLTADLMTPLGVAVWVFYVVPVFLCVFGRNPNAPVAVALVCSGLMVVCFFTDSRSMEPWLAQVNRSMGFVMLGLVAFAVRQLLSTRARVEREDWLKQSQTRALEAVQGELSPPEVGKRVLELLAESLQVHAGVSYVAEKNTLSRAATFGVADDAVPDQIQAGDGLAGQAMEAQAPTLVSDVPASHFKVRTGLGESSPSEILIAPLRVDNTLTGVLEIARIGRFPEPAIELVQRLSASIAVALRSARYREQLRELLAETQQQAEELQAQQEELRVANEELEEQSRALKESQARLEEQQAELEQTNTQLEEQAQALELQKAELGRAKVTADRANRYKSEFLANMSHELRTPLNSALILARQLAENRRGNLSADEVRYAETIYEAGNDLLALINDILDLARVEAGRIDVHPEEVSPAAFTEPLRRTFTPIAEKRGVALRIEIADGAPTLYTDPQRAQQIVKNLLSNAFKFTEKGEVVLRIEREEPGFVRIAVRDTGIGIAPEQRDVIFEAFRQADGTTSRKYGGTGLGLSISRELAQVLGGSILVESAPGKGSTFTLRLPVRFSGPAQAAVNAQRTPRENEGAKGSSAGAPELPAGQPEQGAGAAAVPKTPERRAPIAERKALIDDDRGKVNRPGRLILAIEDDATFARVLYDLAHELDFDCIVAGTAAEGAELAREHRPSGILLDVSLPDGSGLAILERLKRMPDTRHIPVHVVSGSDFTQTALELGAVGYALKPVERDGLVSAIQKLEEKLKQRVRRVLVVEDDVRHRESTRALLATDGVEILGVGTMQEALASLERESFDCMVLDLRLPDGSGFDLLERMASGEQYSFPPVIVYTGAELSREEEAKLRRYSRSIIVKGVRSPERLLDEVTLFLHQVESALPPDRQRMLKDARQREATFEGRRILLAEDDVRNVFALTGVFDSRGAKLEVARNGREALAALERLGEVDLVLMDIMMPEMDGLTAMREIRKNERFARLPIIALTAKAMRDDRDKCLEAGANDYLPKPIDVEKLLSLCRVWMRR